MARQDDVQVVLASAEAALARAVISTLDAGANWAETNLKLDKVQIYCRRLRAALVELGLSDSKANLDMSRARCRELRTVLLELNPSASLPFRCLDKFCDLSSLPRSVCWLGVLENTIARPSRLDASSEFLVRVPASSTGQAIRRFKSRFPAQVFSRKDPPARSSLLRQTIDLLALVLTYLLYFHIDVQLKILSLPSIFP